MKHFSLSGRRVTVLGWARSGRQAARLAAVLGADVFVTDARPEESLDAEARAELAQYAHETGGHTARALKSEIVILSPGVPPEIPFLAGYEGEVWGEIELAYRAMPCPIVAITGTNGKTTTTTLLGEILAAGHRGGKTWVGGNIGRAASSIPLAAGPNDICVLEISSFQLETISTFRPSIAIFLNLRSDHLDRYPSLAAYAAAKERIFMRMEANDTAILNLDDPHTAALAKRLVKPRLVTVSAAGPADWTLDATYDARLLDAVKSPENLLTAVAAARLLGVAPEDLRRSLAEFSGLPHRIERLGALDGVTWYNDSKSTNVHSTEAALKRVTAPIVLILGGRDKGENYLELLPLIREKCRNIIAYGEASARIAEMLPVEVVLHFDDAVRRAHALARPDGAVLLSPACSSYDQFTDYAARGERFRRLFLDGLA
jgi:UDP-N-acetylmuramoylalanine--D-glutamate ligase